MKSFLIKIKVNDIIWEIIVNSLQDVLTFESDKELLTGYRAEVILVEEIEYDTIQEG